MNTLDFHNFRTFKDENFTISFLCKEIDIFYIIYKNLF